MFIYSTVAVIAAFTYFSTFYVPSLIRCEIPACHVFCDMQFVNFSADFTVSFVMRKAREIQWRRWTISQTA